MTVSTAYNSIWPRLICAIIPIACLCLAGCTAEVHVSDIRTKRGLVYRVGHAKPFSGIVLGKGREGSRRYTCRYKKQYKNGLLEGRSYFWYENGKLESIEPYQKGQLNGMLTSYYPNGKIKNRIHLVNGQRGGASGEMFW